MLGVIPENGQVWAQNIKQKTEQKPKRHSTFLGNISTLAQTKKLSFKKKENSGSIS